MIAALRVRHHCVVPVHPLRPQVQAARRPQGAHGEVRQQVRSHRSGKRRSRRSRRGTGRRVAVVGGGGWSGGGAPAAVLPGAVGTAELILDIRRGWSNRIRPLEP